MPSDSPSAGEAPQGPPASQPGQPPSPDPVDLAATWPSYRQLVIDGARIGAVAGALVAILAGGRWGWIGLLVGAGAGGCFAAVCGPRRYRLRVDGDGIRIGRLGGSVLVPWPEVVAVGRREDWHGRSGRLVGLAVCRRGELLPVPVPALTWTASAMRMGGEHPIDRLTRYRDSAVDPVRPWATWRGVPVIEEDLDTWWDHHPDSDPTSH